MTATQVALPGVETQPPTPGTGPHRLIRVIALDLALTATGIAGNGDGLTQPPLWTRTITPRSTGQERIWDINVSVAAHADTHPRLAIIENTFINVRGSTLPLAELHGVIKHWLWLNQIPHVLVAPKTRALYGTGNGNADKAAVLHAARATYGHLLPGGPADIRDHNQADALVLLAMGLDRLGQPLAPVGPERRRALNSVRWEPAGVAPADIVKP